MSKFDMSVFTVEAPVVNGVWQFTDDAPISVEYGGLKWLGYEQVGENYEPGLSEQETLGDSDKLAEYIGKGKIVLDLGAGLGVSAISMALSGFRVIAADISQVMLEAAAKRAARHGVAPENLICARMNGYKLQLADRSVDAVLEVDMLRQVDRPELVVAEIKRVLKHDGFFLQYGSGRSLDYTDEQKALNAPFNAASKDILAYYGNALKENGYDMDKDIPFSSWEQSEKCVAENFVEHAAMPEIMDTGCYFNSNMKWTLANALHKTKTRASGVKQFIPDDIHNAAWAATDAYAKSKYGEDYEQIHRYFNSRSSMRLFNKR